MASSRSFSRCGDSQGATCREPRASTRFVLTRLPLPPLDEQRAIAAYLDRETERIDALVAKKRLLIERLDEYRTALITRTVTRGLPPEAARAAGLDPSPRLKPSGVEWLGEVPEHWEVSSTQVVRRFGRICQRCHAGRVNLTGSTTTLRDVTLGRRLLTVRELPSSCSSEPTMR